MTFHLKIFDSALLWSFRLRQRWPQLSLRKEKRITEFNVPGEVSKISWRHSIDQKSSSSVHHYWQWIKHMTDKLTQHCLNYSSLQWVYERKKRCSDKAWLECIIGKEDHCSIFHSVSWDYVAAATCYYITPKTNCVWLFTWSLFQFKTISWQGNMKCQKNKKKCNQPGMKQPGRQDIIFLYTSDKSLSFRLQLFGTDCKKKWGEILAFCKYIGSNVAIKRW